MKTQLTLLVMVLVLLPHHRSGAQEAGEIPLVRYSPEYVFKDGVYPHIDAVKANDPIPFSRIVTDRYVYDKDLMHELIIKKEIILYDDAGVRASIRTENIWGYVLHGRIYIMLGGKFHRIILQGSVSQFMASASTNEKVYFEEEDSTANYTTTQDLYRGFHRDRYYYRTLTAEGDPCLFDFESNTLSPYEPVELGKLLERDSVLHAEYKPLKKREQKKRMAEFIRRYNKRHPLYFPAQ